jgi:hypothetical protein
MQQKIKIISYHPFAVAAFVFFTPVLLYAYEAAPFVQTLMPTFVTEKSVQLNGRVNPNEMSDTYEWFEWGIVGRSEVYETTHDRLWGGSTQANTSATIIGLAPQTQYFFRQIAENGRGRDVGALMYVTTKPLPSVLSPIVITATKEAVFIGETSATLCGYVSPHGDSKTRTWFEWGTSPTMQHQTSEQGSWGSAGPIEAQLQSLMPGTIYYFRAVAENEQGRSYGVLKVFTTSGSPQSVTNETPRLQDIPSPVTPSEGAVSRTTTSSGTVSAPGWGTPVVAQPQFGPGNFFSTLFGGKNTTVTPVTDSVDNEKGTNEVAAVGASGMFSSLWDMMTGKKPIEVVIEKIGPENIMVHSPVEYRIAYAYRRSTAATDARLRMTFPATVIYIGDNTNNELLLESGSGPERTYVLPIGRIENGGMRALSILGMTTGDAKGFPDVRVRLEYTDASGVHVVAGTTGKLGEGADDAEQNAAGVGSVSSVLLPNSFLGWLLYVLLVVGVIVGIRKAKVYYEHRREALMTEEAPARLAPEPPPFLPGAEEIAPQGV